MQAPAGAAEKAIILVKLKRSPKWLPTARATRTNHSWTMSFAWPSRRSSSQDQVFCMSCTISMGMEEPCLSISFHRPVLISLVRRHPFWVEFNSRVRLPIVQQIRIAEVHQSLKIKDVGTGVKFHALRVKVQIHVGELLFLIYFLITKFCVL